MRIDKLGNDGLKSFSTQNSFENAQINSIFGVKATGALDETKTAFETNSELNSPPTENPNDPKKISKNLSRILNPEFKGDCILQGNDAMAALKAMNGGLEKIPTEKFGNSIEKFSGKDNKNLYFSKAMFTKKDGKDYVILYNDENTIINKDKKIARSEFPKGGYFSKCDKGSNYQINTQPGLADNYNLLKNGEISTDVNGSTIYNGTSSTKNDGTANQSKTNPDRTDGDGFGPENITIAKGDIHSETNKTVIMVPLEKLIPNYKENGAKYIKEHQ